MSSLIPSDLDASRPRSGILTPSSEASLNNYDGGFSVDSESRRRKRADSVAMDHLLKPSIAVKVSHSVSCVVWLASSTYRSPILTT